MATEKTYDFDEAFFTSVFNQLTTNIFIKDAETDVIVYMNDAMKREFGQIHPEGKRCWEILQRGLTDKCPFCSERDKTVSYTHLDVYKRQDNACLSRRPDSGWKTASPEEKMSPESRSK